jgi:hypothetical protein
MALRRYPLEWLTPKQFVKVLGEVALGEEFEMILLVQEKKSNAFTLINLLKWKDHPDLFLDAPLETFAFGSWNPFEFKRIAVVDSNRKTHGK